MDEHNSKEDGPRAYTPPEIVELGDAVDLTLGNEVGMRYIDPGNPPYYADRVMYC